MTGMEDTLKALAANWQGVLDAMAEGRSDEMRGVLIEAMMVVAHANHAQLYGPATTAGSLEVAVRALQAASEQHRAARERPPADVIKLATRWH